MKKSFKKSIAVLLAVLMVVCTFPMTSFAAEKPNINLQFGVFTLSNSSANRRTYTAGRKGSDYASANSGLMNAKLDYNKSTGTLVDPVDSHTYTVGDYFTATVLLENVSQLAATQVAVNYSSNLAPAGIDNERTAFAGEKTSTTSEVFTPGEPVAAQSAHALYNTVTTVGEQSYIDSATNTMYAIFATQDGGDYSSTASTSIGVNTFTNTAVLATFAFKITAEGPISFSLANTTDADDAYYLGTLENGGNVSEYITYAPTENAGSTGLDFMGGNEYVATTKYTIVFKNENGSVISSTEYDEGTAVTVPDLPATSKDDRNHYTYAWDVTPSATAVANATYQVVATPAAHTWDEGVVTKEATATEDGEMTYTCTFDGCGATKTEVIPATGETHTHTWGAWVYNGDAVYDLDTKTGTNGTQTRTCECGESETIEAPNTGMLVRQATQLSIDSSILTKTWVLKDVCDYYDSFYMSVTYPTKEGDKTAIVDEYDTGTSKGKTYYRFSFDKVMPHYLNEEAKYTIYGEKDGVLYWGDTYEYAVTTYLRSQLDKYNTTDYPTTYNNYRRLLADIIWYGYKAQIQQGYGINDGKQTPMTDYITEEQLGYRTTDNLTYETIDDAKYEEIENPVAKIGTNLRMGASVDLVVVMAKNTTACPDLWTLQVEVTKEGSAPEIFNATDYPDMFAQSGKYVNFYYNGVKGNEASVPVYVRLLDKNGNVISNTRRMNIESYCYNKITSDTASQALKDVCDAIMRYAKSSAAYIANKKA